MTATVTAPRPAAVAAVLAQSSTWTSARRKSDSKPFFYIQGSNGAVYMTAADGCTCPAAQHSLTGDCKHQVAVRQRQQPAAPKPRKSYTDLFPKCHGCDDLADTRDGYCDRCASDREWQARRDARSH